MYVSMCGAGLGFAVEWENVQQFPQIKKQNKKKNQLFISFKIVKKAGRMLLF